MTEVYKSKDSDYQSLSIVGECCQGFGTVELARHKHGMKMVVIKRINLDKLKDDVKLVEEEIILTRQLCHPNIIKYLSSFVSGSNVCIISPLMGFGSCRSLLNLHFINGMPENAIALIARDILDALEYVHRRGIIHRAIRASHVLINENGNSCLTGFRYACPIIKNGRWQRQIHSFPTSTARNLNWLSPEVLEQNLQGYNEKSDIYSIGLLITELANGTEPFGDMATTLMLTEKVRGSAPQLLDCTTIPIEEDDVTGDSGVNMHFLKQSKRKFSNGLHEIAALCLQKEAHGRPTAAQLMTHPYFKINRRGIHLAELLKPAIPIGNNVIFNNTDEIQCIDNIQRLSEMDLFSCDWDF